MNRKYSRCISVLLVGLFFQFNSFAGRGNEFFWPPPVPNNIQQHTFSNNPPPNTNRTQTIVDANNDSRSFWELVLESPFNLQVSFISQDTEIIELRGRRFSVAAVFTSIGNVSLDAMIPLHKYHFKNLIKTLRWLFSEHPDYLEQLNNLFPETSSSLSSECVSHTSEESFTSTTASSGDSLSDIDS